MANTIDIKAILDAAILREEEAHRFYAGVSKRMQNPAVRETFAQLAREELGHKTYLQECLKSPTAIEKLPVPTDYKVAEATLEPDLSIDMKPADALALAMKKEQRAAELYQGLAEGTSDTILKSAFQGLARMELGHKTRLENLFVDIGYPEAF